MANSYDPAEPRLSGYMKWGKYRDKDWPSPARNEYDFHEDDHAERPQLPHPVLVRGTSHCVARWAAKNGLSRSHVRIVESTNDLRGRRGSRLIVLDCAHLARGDVPMDAVEYLGLTVEGASCP